MRWARHAAGMGEKRNGCRIFVGKPGGNRLLGIPRHRRVDLREMRFGGMC
jgi:hypothetical protein